MGYKRIFTTLSAAGLVAVSSHAAAGWMDWFGGDEPSISFAPAVNYSTGTTGGPGPAAESMVAADMDNDGDMDVVSADWWGSGVPVMLNNGDGTFGDPVFNDLGSAAGVGSVSVGDYNNDGNMDVAATGGTNLYILHGQGNGQLSIAQTLPYIPGGQYQGYSIDANMDGKLDIVAPSLGGIKVYLNQGSSFVEGPTSSITGIISAAVALDFNQDGITDLALSDGLTSHVILMRGNGDATFEETSRTLVGFIPEDVTAGDLNGDGYDDLVASDSFSFTVSVVLSDGAGGYKRAKRYLGTAGPVSARLADLDLDGDLDIVV
ncbi:MAG: FG-GAP repeat domain-containing protein, partial [Nevskiales bacterium]